MAGPRGYSSYRGRTPIWKIVLAVLLVMVILTAAVVIRLQKNIVYDENGRPRLDLPPEEANGEPLPEETDPAVDLTIQEPEPPEVPPEPEEPPVKALSLAPQKLTAALWEETQTALQTAGGGAVALTMKDRQGNVYFTPTAPISGSVLTAKDTASVLEAICGETSAVHAIARLTCFRDTRGANSNVRAMGLKNTGGYLFYDGENTVWMDPAKEDVQTYLCQLAKDLAELGFDEILLTEFSYPTVGKINKIAYTGAETLSENLKSVLQALRTALEPYEILLSVELPETVITAGSDETAGLVLADVAALADRIYAQTTAERTETLAALVKQAAGERTVSFVPELAEIPLDRTGSWLQLPA